MSLDAVWHAFQQAYTNAVGVPGIDDAEAAQLEQQAVEATDNFARFRALLDERAAQLVKQPGDQQPAKVGDISVPKFDGTYTDWISWRAQFKSKVIATGLSADSKIDLLLGALEKEARQCAGDTEHRDIEDFERIWKKLELTYDNKYQIVTAHVNRILDLPSSVEPSSIKMRLLIDTVDQELRSLKRFEYNTDSWSPLVAVLLLRKLDRQTLSVWEMDRDAAKPPTIEELFPFLERRILALRNLNSAAASFRGENGETESRKRLQSAIVVPPKRQRRDARPEEASTAPECPECKPARHYLWFCREFRS